MAAFSRAESSFFSTIYGLLLAGNVPNPGEISRAEAPFSGRNSPGVPGILAFHSSSEFPNVYPVTINGNIDRIFGACAAE